MQHLKEIFVDTHYRAKCSLCHIIKPSSPNHFSDQYLDLISQGRSDVRCKACTSSAMRTDLECNDCHEIKSIDKFSATQRRRGDEAVGLTRHSHTTTTLSPGQASFRSADIASRIQECLSCREPPPPSQHSIDYESDQPKSLGSSKPRMIDVTSNRSKSTKASTYAAPSAGTTVIGSDYTSRDGGVRVNPIGSSIASTSTSGTSTQSQSQDYKKYDSEDEDDIIAEGY